MSTACTLANAKVHYLKMMTNDSAYHKNPLDLEANRRYCNEILEMLGAGVGRDFTPSSETVFNRVH